MPRNAGSMLTFLATKSLSASLHYPVRNLAGLRERVQCSPRDHGLLGAAGRGSLISQDGSRGFARGAA